MGLKYSDKVSLFTVFVFFFRFYCTSKRCNDDKPAKAPKKCF